MSKKTAPIGIILLLIAIPLVFWLISPSQKPKPSAPPPSQISSSPTPTPIAQTVLSFSPSPLVIASQSATIAVTVDTGANLVTAAQLELVFDPKTITIIDIQPGTFFADSVILLKNIDAKNGKISYVSAVSPTGQAKAGTGTIATLSFTTNLASGGKTDITFSPKTIVTAEKVQVSVLKASENATIFYVQQAGTGQQPFGPVKPSQ